MRTLATLMATISLVTVALFAHALATVDDPAPVVQVEQAASRQYACRMTARERYEELVDDLCARTTTSSRRR